MLLLTHPLYMAPISLYAQLYAYKEMIIDDSSIYTKQTLRNRTSIATECGIQSLTIPIIHNGTQPMRDIRISEHDNWRRKHWNAISSAYRKSPFFDYYADDFAHFYDERGGFLMDFNLRLHTVISELLGLEQKTYIASNTQHNNIGEEIIDLRCIAETTKTMTDKQFATIEPYYQVFAQRNGFIPNLSIIDLLFNMGPEGLIILRDSIGTDK